MDSLFYLVPAASLLALFFAWFFYNQMKKESEGTPTMREIAQYVREGAMAYLKQQYKVVLIVFIILALLFSFMAYVLHVQKTQADHGKSHHSAGAERQFKAGVQ